MKKFDNFLNENIDRGVKAKEWLLGHPFIIEDENTKETKIVKASHYNYPDSLTKINDRTYLLLQYHALVRYLLFAWLYKYDGENEILNNIKESFISGSFKVKDSVESELIRPFTQIPTNNTCLTKFFKPTIGDTSTDTTDPLILAALLFKKDDLFTENNIIKMYNMVNGLTKRADEGEAKTIKLLEKLPMFNNVRPAEQWEDKRGIDAWTDYGAKKIKTAIQVKEPKNGTEIDMFWGKPYYIKDGVKINKKPEYKLTIKDTMLAINNYNKRSDGNAAWKFLILWDHKKGKIYQINSSCINRIFKNDKGDKFIYINMNLDAEWLPKMIKTYDI